MPEIIPTLYGYQMTEKIYEGPRTLIYRAQRQADNQPVVIKFLKSEYPSFEELVQFRNQYTITKNLLELDGIVHPYALENYHNGFALVMAEMGADSLYHYLTDNPLALTEFFQVAIAIIKVLEGLYQNRVIHKDIKPQNILIHPETKQVKLIDFSIASLLPRETQEIQSPNVLEGTLAYLSPEQTGRMNRGIDYRTDFYSLGVTFYELLTGQVPFQSDDPMELVHCHIAQAPTPPKQMNAAIPQVVNDLIIKLMAKTAEERYQSAFGIRYDLEQCQQQWEAQESLTPFELGQRDISDRFQIPEKLYGREAEVSTLLAAFERVSEGHTEMMQVAGFSGIGKTALVNEVHKPIVRQRGYFIKGKFDQFKRNIPFSALVQAFQTLMRQLLTETAEQVQEWKTRILEALGENGQVIIEVIPELEQIIGKQPPVPEVEGSAAQNRFNRLLHKFINVFTTAEHPLVIFLDDLQWIDSASLKLMQLLMSQTESHYLLLMGAYRDNEVSAAHPLILTLDEIRQTDALVNQITLGPLEQPDLNRLIADTLSCPTEKATPLTELVIPKTKGNPFFTNQFLKFLHDEKLIAFDFECSYWQCDIAQVKRLAVSDDVVEFMALQLQKLPAQTQNVLKLAACIGNQFDLATLAIVHENSQADTAADLWKALQEGLIIPISDIYKFFQSTESSDASEVQDLSIPYRFLHDRVQQAAYSLIPEEQKSSTHLKIGQLLKSHTPDKELDDKIFDIVNQLNHGVDLILAQTDRYDLAQLNLRAGRKAIASTAHAAANQYLTVGLTLLPTDSWQTHYDLTLAVYELAAEAAYLNGDFSQQEQLVEVVLENAQSLLDKVKVYEIKSLAYVAQHQQMESIQTILAALKLFGVNFPEEPEPSDIQQGLEETKALWNGQSIEDLIKLPDMKNPEKLAIMRLLSNAWSTAITTKPALVPLIASQMVTLSIKHGNADLSAFGYAFYGFILCGTEGGVENGYQFGQLGLRMLERSKAMKPLKAKVLIVNNVLILHWKKHLRKTLKPFLEAYQSALELGDLESVGYSAADYVVSSYFVGKELTNLEREMATYHEAIFQLKQNTPLTWIEINWQVILNLLGKAGISSDTPPCSLIGKAYNEKNQLPHLIQSKDGFALYLLYLNKLTLCYFFHDYPHALENARSAESYLPNTNGIFLMVLFHFYDSLIQLMVYPDTQESEQQPLLEKVVANQEKMLNWAKHAPMNFQHKFELVEAERHRVLGKNTEAMDFYDRAIAGAKENEYLQEEALANEVAARFYLGWGKDKIAQVYLTNAYYCYARWGAKAKVDDLETRYPELLAPIFNYDFPELSTTDDATKVAQRTIVAVSQQHTHRSELLLDFKTVMKASQAISGEIRLDKLLATLMRVLIENAGAEKGVLMLRRDDKLVVEAQCQKNSAASEELAEAFVLQSIPVEESTEIPVSLINYVSRTHETQVIGDASREMTYAADPYIMTHQPKSVLCSAIINQGKLVGVLYLENNLTTEAFTAHRLKVLNILSSQAAISLENALLYETLEQRVAKRTRQLAKRTEQLAQANQEITAANEEITAANEEITKLNEQLKSENLRMAAELEVSRKLQKMVLPKDSELQQIEELDIAGFMEAADEVAGDYYDVLQHADGRVKLGIGDVTGHGLESGVVMLMVQMGVRTLLTTDMNDPERFIKVLNQAVYKNVKRIETNKNLTLSLLDYQAGTLTITGQHEEILLVRQGGQIERIDTLDLGFLVGVLDDISEFTSHQQISLQPGDGIVLYTDGITEAQNLQKQDYGLDRLCEVVSRHWHLSAQQIQQAVISHVRQYIGTQKVDDDITLLVLKQK
jgi:predicted ATPase/serine phosphatase RsbU (regulator of sigma subunit)